MMDFLGKELNIGDKVVYLQHNKTFSDLCRANVVGFTPKKVRLQTHPNRCVCTKYPENIVKVDW